MVLRSAWAVCAAMFLASSSFQYASAADVCLGVQIQCDGFEPNYQFTTGLDGEGDGAITFVDPENPNWETEPLILEGCVLGNDDGSFQVTGGAPVDLDAVVTPGECIEPDDEVRQWSVSSEFNQGALTDNPNRISGTGCCLVVQ